MKFTPATPISSLALHLYTLEADLSTACADTLKHTANPDPIGDLARRINATANHIRLAAFHAAHTSTPFASCSTFYASEVSPAALAADFAALSDKIRAVHSQTFEPTRRTRLDATLSLLCFAARFHNDATGTTTPPPLPPDTYALQSAQLSAALADAVEQIEYLAPESFDDDAHRSAFESRLAGFRSLLASTP